MEQRIGGSYGQGNAAVAPSLSESEEAAQRWAGARQRLDHARMQHADASKELDEATRVEQEAWTILENTSGRGMPIPTVSVTAPSGVRR